MSATILLKAKKETASELREHIKKNFRKTSEDFAFIKQLLDNGMTLTMSSEKAEFILTEQSRLSMHDWEVLGEMTENYHAVMPFEEIWMTELNGREIAKGNYGFVNGEFINHLKFERS